jgi:AbiU2
MRLEQLEWINHSSGFQSCKIGDYKIWKHPDGKTYDVFHQAGLEVWEKLGPAATQGLLYELSSKGWRRVADRTDQTAEELKKLYVAKMGQPLGEVYSALWQAVAIIFVYWKDYGELFGAGPKRIGILNQAAPQFFRMLQDELWGISLLHIARLTDPTITAGQANLTIRALPDLITDAGLKARVSALVAGALKETEFCRDWRNRLIAHTDLKLALEQSTKPLADASRAQVNAALDAVAKVLNALGSHYCQSETRFDLTPRNNGAFTMLHVLNQGIKARDKRAKRLESGRPADGDLDTEAL